MILGNQSQFTKHNNHLIRKGAPPKTRTERWRTGGTSWLRLSRIRWPAPRLSTYTISTILWSGSKRTTRAPWIRIRTETRFNHWSGVKQIIGPCAMPKRDRWPWLSIKVKLRNWLRLIKCFEINLVWNQREIGQRILLLMEAIRWVEFRWINRNPNCELRIQRRSFTI